MKWVSLAVLLAAIFPLSSWLRQHPKEAPKLWMLLGFLPFAFSFVHLNMAFISWITWPGYVKGAEFSVMDALALSIYFGMQGPAPKTPFWLFIGLYILTTIASTFSAAEPTAALFYSWQLVRVLFVFVVVARGCADPRVPVAILKGMAAGLILELVVALWQRFALGLVQAPGTMYHQNLLAMMIHFVDLPIFALLLSGPCGRLLTAAVPAGLVTTVLTGSRGAIAFSLIGYAAIFVFSALRGWTLRKRKALMLGAAALVLIIPTVIVSLDERFASQAQSIASDYDERAAFERVAQMMLADEPSGKGANHYVVAANLEGYNERAGVAAAVGSGSANVHNVYFLVAAETGYLGLITFVLMLLRPLLVAMLCGWDHRGDRRGDLLIGLGVALLVIYLHNFFEWIFVLAETQYMFAIDIGLVAGLATQLGYWPQLQLGETAIRGDYLSINRRQTPASAATIKGYSQSS